MSKLIKLNITPSLFARRAQAAIGMLALCLILAVGCKKKDEEKITNIEVDVRTPIVNIPNDFNVRIEARNETGVEYLTVAILDPNGAAPVASQTVYPEDGSVVFTKIFIFNLEDVRLPSGTYTVHITAHAKGFDSKAFGSFQAVAPPKQNEGLAVILGQGQNKSLVLTNSNFTTVGELPVGDYGRMAYNSWKQNFAVTKPSTSKVEWFSPTLENVNSFDPGNMVDLGVVALPVIDDDKKMYYVPFVEGIIYVFDQNGALHNTIYAENERRIQSVAVNDDFIVAAQNIQGDQYKEIKVYHKGSGAVAQGREIDFNVRRLLAIDNDQILLFGNQLNGSGQIWAVYNISTNALNYINNGVPDFGDFRGAALDDFGVCYVAVNPKIYRLDIDNQSAQMIAQMGGITDLQLDKTSDVLYVSNFQTIRRLNSNGTDAGPSINFGQPVKSFSIRYNK